MAKGEHTVQPIKSVDDIKRMSKYLQEKNGIIYSTVFKFGLYSGLRISDILGLDVEDVENKSNIVMHNGGLQDIAPTFLKLMGVPNNPDFEGKPLF